MQTSDLGITSLNNAGIGGMIAGLVLLGTVEGVNAILWGAALLVVGALAFGASFAMVYIKNQKKRS